MTHITMFRMTGLLEPAVKNTGLSLLLGKVMKLSNSFMLGSLLLMIYQMSLKFTSLSIDVTGQY